MFGKLKDKLKSALSVFSSEAEEVAEVKEIEVEEPVKEEKKVEEKPVKEKKKAEKKEKPKKEVVKEVIVEEPKEEIKEEVEEKVIEEAKSEEPKEEKGFFSKLKDKFSAPDETEETVEEPAKEEKVIEEPKEVIKETQTVPKEKVEEIKSEVEETPKPKEESEAGFFSKIKKSITTKTISEEKYEDLFWNLELVLLENNVSVEVIEKIKEDLKEELVDKPLPRDVEGKIQETLKRTMKEILTIDSIDLLQKIKDKKGPFVITFFGINGVGKTTSIAKLTHLLQQSNMSVVLAACDTFRAAAIDQLEEHANNLGVKIIKHDYNSDAAAVAFDAIKYAEKNNIDVVMIDTAGRLHSNTNLMAELEKIIRVTNPDMKIFVGESITGNDCIEQARKFNELVQMDGAILTKVDVDEKGGAPLSISYTIKKPILYLGVGQEYKDFEKFDADVILGRLGF
ncbi:signal recognition particle-docking protein FtsY [Candidatus Woesearchaeota archaeon]|jgi:fused signal recognition particle receptor|nr:signal recognition particle-docking protein FtsY [Candidatus Woesearchaeota archaeon]MBT4150405.1 signal recognition particle-docking protein FtsY [Candidatus Woesearchaeota archaeon]MBT4247405.1 signal recognition particle-docking protein FtsY [Candidatus Woesearchaeota archaeon]MBT4434540.1 signal recognition particle-docking protein FtsY [Candidatus Woesearchaeota archaeon]MBT7331714.1 signal recognition particle-docking protein FtsY [Candidatus Woesearchaeota archaeon]